MTITSTTTSPTWNIDYRWDARNRKEYFIQVLRPTPHPAEQRSFQSRIAAREAALLSGLQPEGEIREGF